MEVSIENTQVKLFIRIGNSETTLRSSKGLNDNCWHTIKILREGPRIILQVNNDEAITGRIVFF
jgi:hypothetical protein